jgi:3-oxoacyl-[acyl-carrier protein] reductase
MIGLRGKRALITGGSRGVGAATAELFAEHGANVVIGYRNRRADAEALARNLHERFGTTVAVHAADVSTRAGAEALVDRAASVLDGLDFFVGNAGIWPPEDIALADMADERWQRTMDENVNSIFWTTRAAIRQMADGGRIVLVSSTAGQRGEAFHADYAASKGAMISLVKSLAPELGARGINVNSVAPGWIDTEMCVQPFAGGGRGRIAASIPVGRIATPHDIAGPIVFLCSDLARHVNGEILNVNGGSVLCG